MLQNKGNLCSELIFIVIITYARFKSSAIDIVGCLFSIHSPLPFLKKTLFSLILLSFTCSYPSLSLKPVDQFSPAP